MKKRLPQPVKAARVRLERVALVLFRPQLPENIGAAARAACNMGLSRLVVVEPADLNPERLRMMATGAAAHVLERMVVKGDLAEALAPFQYVVGTTAREGGVRQDLLTPRQMAARVVEISRYNDVALLFGPENWGLTNRELPCCQALVTIPTADCASLNLAQAVMVLAYELWVASAPQPRFEPRLANHQELESMYAVLQETLVKINYIGHQNPEHWMFNVRRFFNRHGLRARDTQVIKGVCRQIDWYVRRRLEGTDPPDGDDRK
ncbi:MAG: RNA methyltransferase [Deltaproteobacteria bacterium]|nr:RNA methyltransferase [Deltaproteobacteria bacterium]